MHQKIAQDNTETCPIQTVAERSASPAVSQIENNQKKDEGEKQVMTKNYEYQWHELRTL